jgi:hypothetical protein
MSEEKLRQMLQNGFMHESSFVERKPGNFKDREARKTIVAFANSTPEGQESVLFIGVDDKTGKNLGVSDPDATQRKYSQVLEECVNYKLGSLKPLAGGGHVEEIPDCKVEACDGITVTFLGLSSRTSFSESLERVTIEFDPIRNRPLLLITAPGR